MVIHTPPASRATPHRFGPARFIRDAAYVLPGFFISTFAFVVLVTLFAVSIGTLVIWIGALLLPMTLFIASGFAGLTRSRLRHWGLEVPAPRYRTREPGVAGFIRWIGDPRLWLDLVFETLVAFPLRTFTFCVAVTWIAGALGGLTWVLWGFYIPDGELRLPGRVLEALTEGAIPDAISHSFLLEVVFYFVLGAGFLVSLPFVMRGLAWMDAAASAAALGEAPGNGGGSAAAPVADAPTAPTLADMRIPLETSAAAMPWIERGRSVSGEGWAWIAAAFAAVATIAISWPVLAAVYQFRVTFAMTIAVSQVGALLLAVRVPWAAIGLGALSSAAATALAWGAILPVPWSVPLLIAQAVLVLIVSLRHAWPWAVAAWLVPQLAVLLAFVVVGRAHTELGNLYLSAAISAGVAAIGVTLRLLMRNRGALRAERLEKEELSVERRELAERNRIAQELHDVVAHSMSVISVQATTAKYRLEGVSDEAADEFESIAGSSRQALSEMRGLLAVLRARDGEAPLVPQPEFGDIVELVEATRRSGASIELTGEVEPSAVPPATGLTAYRIVQEALSNAVRHSPGSSIGVAIRSQGDALEIEVVNGAPSGDAPEEAPGAGLGLAGIGDRVAALGGAVEAGPTSDGGFCLAVSLPLG